MYPPVAPLPPRPPVTLTGEQNAVVRFNGRLGQIKARAGTGKTFVLEHFAQARPDLKILYVVYNRANRLEAQARFPRNTTVHTNHSLSWGVGRRYGQNGVGDIDLHSLLKMDPWRQHFKRVGQVKNVVETLQNWLISADSELTLSHIPPEVRVRYPDRHPRARSLRAAGHEQDMTLMSAETLLDLTRTLWRRASDEKDHDIKMPHDGYLKKYQLSGPTLNYDVIMVDEAQDSNEVILNIVLNQRDHAQILMVGDDCQQIYGYRGAINAMASVEADAILPLTRSHRFPEQVAQIANTVLSYKGETMLLSGRTDYDAIVHNDANTFDLTRNHAYISRTNAGLMAEAMRMAEKGERIHFSGGIQKYPIRLVDDAYRLYKGQRNERMEPELKPFQTWADLVDHAEIFKGSQEAILVKLITKKKDKIPALTEQVRRCNVEHPDQATVILTSAHRSKGLEWDRVRLGDDFFNPFEERKQRDDEEAKSEEEIKRKQDEELNLLYVAATRAKKEIALNPVLREFVRRANLRFDRKPELSDRQEAIVEEGQTLPSPVADELSEAAPVPVGQSNAPASLNESALGVGAKGPMEEWQEVATRWVANGPRFLAQVLAEVSPERMNTAMRLMDGRQPVDTILATLAGAAETQAPVLAGGVRR